MKMRQKIGLLGQLAVAAVWYYLTMCGTICVWYYLTMCDTICVWYYLTMCDTTCVWCYVCVAPPSTLVPNPTDDYF